MRPSGLIHERFGTHLLLREWLELLGNLGRAPATLDAYGRGVAHYLEFCSAASVAAEAATLEHISLYLRALLPGSATAVANSTLLQRITAIRLWYDHLVYNGVRSHNPVPRGQHTLHRQAPDHAGFTRGLVTRLVQLPHVATDDDWHRILAVAAGDTVRNRLMLAFAYYGALRREELVSLRIDDLDFAHRLIKLRAETTKGKRARIVCYSPVIAPTLMIHMADTRRIAVEGGALFRSASDRNYGAPLTKWSWSKTVLSWAEAANVGRFSTHSFRHLRLTHLSRAGWKLHELTAYAGHRDPRTTLVYLNLSGGDLAARMATSVAHIDANVGATLFG